MTNTSALHLSCATPLAVIQTIVTSVDHNIIVNWLLVAQSCTRPILRAYCGINQFDFFPVKDFFLSNLLLADLWS